jgi:hypothetical protein
MKARSLNVLATCPSCVDIVLIALMKIADHETKCDTLVPCECAVHIAQRALDAFRAGTHR